MTKQQFVEKHRHTFGGMIADAATTTAKSGELSIRIRGWFNQIDKGLADIYDEFVAKIPEQKK